MRKLFVAVTGVLACVLGVAPAQATFHLEKVNEVMTASASGDTAVQFVELLDKGGAEEAFTPAFAPYQLVVYDGAGKVVGQQTLDPNGLRSAASGREYLVSSAAADAALGVTGDERLTIAIPTDAAQVCFRGSPGNVSCISFGQISQPVTMSSQGTGAVHAPVPPDGESDQRQPDDTVQVAAPTPKAPNQKGSPSTPAPTTPAPSQPFQGVRPASRHAHVDRHGVARIVLSCPAATSGGCHGRLTLSTGPKHTRIGAERFALAAGARRAIAIRLTPRGRRLLARRGHLTALATAVARDGAGRSVRRSRRVELS